MNTANAIPGFITQLDTGACHCPRGLYGFVRDEEKLIHVQTTSGSRSTLGADDEVALRLVMSWAPLPGDMGEDDDLEHEAEVFVRNWDMMLPGEHMTSIVDLWNKDNPGDLMVVVIGPPGRL